MPNLTKWSDQKLIEALTKGGQSRELAVAQALEQFIHLVPKIAQKTGLSKEDALDPYTDSIIHLSDQVSKGEFRGESSIGTYFYKIFYFKSVDLFRKRTTKQLEFSAKAPEVADQQPLAIQRIEDSDEVEQLHKNMDKLGPPCKNVLLDWGFWGYSMTEIAERNGLGGSTQAKDMKYKCLKKLRKLM
ncbi:MAG: RNA polymerase sigma factor [Saprospiraceae bacterium]